MISSVLPHIPLLEHVIEVDADSYTEMVTNGSSRSPSIDIEDEDEATIFYTSGVLGRHLFVFSIFMAYLRFFLVRSSQALPSCLSLISLPELS